MSQSLTETKLYTQLKGQSTLLFSVIARKASQAMTLRYDKAATAERITELSRYLEANVLCGDNFICKHFKACSDSHAGKGSFSEGQLHYLGRHYDVIEGGVPLRIVVVGQEYGEKTSKVSLTARYNQINTIAHKYRFKREAAYCERNPHMRGTTSVLRLLFSGTPGSDYESEFIHFEDGTSCHIFDAFGLVNYLLCAAHAGDSKTRGMSSRAMKVNCGEHFRSVLELLEPTVIIVQGKGIWKWLRRSFDSLNVIQGELYQGRINGTPSLVASFTHPSAGDYRYNWGINYRTDYLRNVVSPTIQHMRSLLLRNKHD